MTKPVQVTFRNMKPVAAIEEVIHARVAWLETFYPDIVGCRVLVEIPHRHRGRGRHVGVRVELSLPGEDAVVSHAPTLHGRLKDVEHEAHHKGDDIEAVHKYALVAVHEAFDAARRRLQDFARRQRADVKTHQAPAHGRVVSLPAGDDHGFIESADGRLLYFHRASVLVDGLPRLDLGSEVAFVEEAGDRRPQASTVRVLGKHHYATR